MKIIGLDVGERRIGVAVADAGVRIAIPDCTLEVDGSELEQIFQIAKSYRTKLFVVGMPRNVAGQETAQSQFVRQFAMALQDYIPEARVKFQDETLTSVEAEKRLKARKRRYQKAEIDAEAASIILQDFIESFTGEIASRGARNTRRATKSSVGDETGIDERSRQDDVQANEYSGAKMAPNGTGEPAGGVSSAEMPVDAAYRQMAPPGSAAAVVGGGMMMAGAGAAGNAQAVGAGVSGSTHVTGGSISGSGQAAGVGVSGSTMAAVAGMTGGTGVGGTGAATGAGDSVVGAGAASGMGAGGQTMAQGASMRPEGVAMTQDEPKKSGKKSKKSAKKSARAQTGQDGHGGQSSQDSQGEQGGKSGTSKKKSKLFVILGIVLFLAVACGVGGFMAYGWYNDSLTPVAQVPNCSISNDEACREVEFTIAEGESSKQIADNLKSADLIRDSLAFQLYLRFNNKEGQLKPGTYSLNKTHTVQDIVEKLIKGVEENNVFRVTFLPGDTIKSIKQRLVNKGYAKDVVDAAFAKQYDHPVLQDKPADASLEGYIYGDTYEFYKGETVENIILTALNQLYKVVQENDLINAYKAQGLNLYQGITLASIVQKEAKSDDQPTVAQVFLKRIEIGMPLGSDVTTQYALDLVDPDRQTYTDNTLALEVDSPYNTRKYGGLPPGPISNPGKSALNAVAHPSSTSYLYFLTGDDGMMYYGSTEAEHQQNITNHCKEMCSVKL